jgi:hypothetical protein
MPITNKAKQKMKIVYLDGERELSEPSQHINLIMGIERYFFVRDLYKS